MSEKFQIREKSLENMVEAAVNETQEIFQTHELLKKDVEIKIV